MRIDETILRVALYGGEFFIKCPDPKSQESTRVAGFHYRTKLEGSGRKAEARNVGIQKVENESGYFVRIYKREESDVYIRNPLTGELEPFVEDQVNLSPEGKRMLELMKKDRVSADEILSILTDFGESKVCVLTALESYNPEEEE